MTIVQGWDISLNHGAVVELKDGELNDFFYWTTTASSANKSKNNGSRLKLLKTKDRQLLSIHRLSWIADFLSLQAISRRPDYIGLEDYAIRSEQGAHYLGEVGGLARLLCWNSGIRLRLHDPISIKMFTTHDGTAQKDSIERTVKERWGADFSDYNPPLSKPRKGNTKPPKQNRTTSEDLADAFAIAKMVHVEVLMRSGNILMNELHQKEIQVFNRVTKTYPVNLLNREWLFRGEEEFFVETNNIKKPMKEKAKRAKAILVRK